ncbi:MAG: hypothetical protein JW967_10640 [Dehalococcoidales bacterium]|nr:hypothetical protein [Dehalococcoidales bacterium]
MNRAYVLFHTKTMNVRKVTRTLQDKAGVIMVDVLEDQPSVMIVVQASSRLRLAEMTVKAIASVEDLTEGIFLMPTLKHMNRYAVEIATSFSNN